jgi:hypothetical protein
MAAKRVDTKIMAGYRQILPGNSRFPTSSDQQKVTANNPDFSLPAFHFWFFTSGFPSNSFALCLESGKIET